MDYAKGDTQKKSLDIIYEQLGDTPSFILGDFNFQENSNDYHYARQLFLDAKWEALITEDVPTFNNYGQATRITTCDYTFIKNSCFLINSYQVLDETFDGLYASDHYAIVIVAHLM